MQKKTYTRQKSETINPQKPEDVTKKEPKIYPRAPNRIVAPDKLPFTVKELGED